LFVYVCVRAYVRVWVGGCTLLCMREMRLCACAFHFHVYGMYHCMYVSIQLEVYSLHSALSKYYRTLQYI